MMNIQILYVIINDEGKYYNSQVDNHIYWATYFGEAKQFTNKTQAERANCNIGEKIYKVRIAPELLI